MYLRKQILTIDEFKSQWERYDEFGKRSYLESQMRGAFDTLSWFRGKIMIALAQNPTPSPDGLAVWIKLHRAIEMVERQMATVEK